MNVVLSSFVSAQYGSAAGSGNVGYGGKGTSVPSGDYGHTAQDSSLSPSGSASDGNSEVSFTTYAIRNTNIFNLALGILLFNHSNMLENRIEIV